MSAEDPTLREALRSPDLSDLEWSSVRFALREELQESISELVEVLQDEPDPFVAKALLQHVLGSSERYLLFALSVLQRSLPASQDSFGFWSSLPSLVCSDAGLVSLHGTIDSLSDLLSCRSKIRFFLYQSISQRRLHSLISSLVRSPEESLASVVPGSFSPAEVEESLLSALEQLDSTEFPSYFEDTFAPARLSSLDSPIDLPESLLERLKRRNLAEPHAEVSPQPQPPIPAAEDDAPSGADIVTPQEALSPTLSDGASPEAASDVPAESPAVSADAPTLESPPIALCNDSSAPPANATEEEWEIREDTIQNMHYFYNKVTHERRNHAPDGFSSADLPGMRPSQSSSELPPELPPIDVVINPPDVALSEKQRLQRELSQLAPTVADSTGAGVPESNIAAASTHTPGAVSPPSNCPTKPLSKRTPSAGRLSFLKEHEDNAITGDLEVQIPSSQVVFVPDKHVEFEIKVQRVYYFEGIKHNQEWSIMRRYARFTALEEMLRLSYPQVGFPEIPKPTLVRSFHAQYIDQKRSYLEQYLRTILRMRMDGKIDPPSDVDSDPLHSFLRGDNLCTGFQRMSVDGRLTLALPCRQNGAILTTLLTDLSPVSLLSVTARLSLQNNQCNSCSTCLKTNLLTRNYHFCEYSQAYYCSDCFSNQKSMVPARIVHCWDFRQFPVSDRAKAYLESIYNQPLFCLTALNPLLIAKVPLILSAQSLRVKLNFMYDYILTCYQHDALIKHVENCQHLMASTEVYSMKDMYQLKKGILLPFLKNVHDIYCKHITSDCTLCPLKGHICEICNDQNPIFSFQTDTVRQCSACNSFYHGDCFKGTVACSKCSRIKMRRSRASSLSAELRDSL